MNSLRYLRFTTYLFLTQSLFMGGAAFFGLFGISIPSFGGLIVIGASASVIETARRATQRLILTGNINEQSLPKSNPGIAVSLLSMAMCSVFSLWLASKAGFVILHGASSVYFGGAILFVAAVMATLQSFMEVNFGREPFNPDTCKDTDK